MTASATSSTNSSPYVTPDSSPEIPRKSTNVILGHKIKKNTHSAIDDAVAKLTPVVQNVASGSLKCGTAVSSEALKSQVKQKLPGFTHGIANTVIELTQKTSTQAAQKSTDQSIATGFNAAGACAKKSTDIVGDKCLPPTQDSEDDGSDSDDTVIESD